ncbi:ATPase, partial [Lachnotalea glycerini]
MSTLNITIEQMKLLQEEYQLIDMRDSIAYSHGFIPGAVNIKQDELLESDKLSKDKKLILYCMKGIISSDAAKELSKRGYDAYNLEGGYGKWLLESFKEDKRCEEIEKSIQKKFHKDIMSKFTKAVREYELVKEGDKIAVCISGGKDSMLMAKLFQELKRYNK